MQQTENLFTPDCIRTFTGKYVNIFKPDVSMFCIKDIAHALSMIPRFGGHLPGFYSVAQHSLAVCNSVGNDYQLQALMHDASEAYLMDIPSPIKHNLWNYQDIEEELMYNIAHVFKFDWPIYEQVKLADRKMLQWEWDNLMVSETTGRYWTSDGIKVTYWTPAQAEYNFLRKYDEITKR